MHWRSHAHDRAEIDAKLERRHLKSKMRAIVHEKDFLDNNYLCTDQRVPVTLLQTNACSPLATNAIGGNI